MTVLRLKKTPEYFAMWLSNWWLLHESHYDCEEEDGAQCSIVGLDSLPDFRPDMRVGVMRLAFFGYLDSPAAPWPAGRDIPVIVHLDTFPLPADRTRVDMQTVGRPPVVFCAELLACIAEDFEVWDQVTPGLKPAGELRSGEGGAVGRLVKSVPMPGTAAQFDAGMEGLFNRLASKWTAPSGERLLFYKEWPVFPFRARWEVGADAETPTRWAGIEASEGPTGTQVDFFDGYRPKAPLRPEPPIGPAFAAFVEMICGELQGGDLHKAGLGDFAEEILAPTPVLILQRAHSDGTMSFVRFPLKTTPELFNAWFGPYSEREMAFATVMQKVLHQEAKAAGKLHQVPCWDSAGKIYFTDDPVHIPSKLYEVRITHPEPALIWVTLGTFDDPPFDGYGRKLKAEIANEWPDAREYLFPPDQEAEPAAEIALERAPEVIAAPESGKARAPWEQVPNVGNDRLIVRLIWEGYRVKDIQLKLAGRSDAQPVEKTVRNIISGLRRVHGRGIVPKREDLRGLTKVG